MSPDRADAKSYNAATELVDGAIARGFADKVAFCDGARALTYAELRERTWRMAAAFAALGLKPESRIALLLHDGVDFPVAFWGGIRAGSVVLTLNTLLTAEQYALHFGRQPRLGSGGRRAACQDDPFGSRSAAAPAHRHIDRCRRYRDRSIFRPRCA